MREKLICLCSFSLVLGMFLTSTANATEAGIVGWWTFDEGSGTIAYDSSGNENHGTVGGIKWVVGKMNGALEFDGSSTPGVEIPHSESLRLLNQGDFTLTAWFNADEIPTQNKVVLQHGDLNGTGRTWLYYRASDDSIATYLGGGPTLSGVAIEAGKWYHAAVVITEAGSTDTIQIYVNGEAAGAAGQRGMEDSQGDYFIGRHKNPANNIWDGLIDDVRLYNRKLTQGEIARVMIGRDPTLASDPSPDDEAVDVPRDVVLSWMPGIYAPPVNGHKVYLSESFNDVNDGVSGIAQDANSYDPGQLDYGKTYYWRVDEVNGPPDYTVYEGSVWQFATEPVAYAIENITAKASSMQSADMGPENTVNGSGLDDNDLHSKNESEMWLSSVAGPQPSWIEYDLDKVYKLHQMIVWNSNQMVEPVIGLGLKNVTIEYSTNGTDYTTLGTTHEFAQAPGTSGYAYNTTVDMGGVAAKYVKLTANSNWGGILNQYGLSEVRFFYIPIQAREPSPADGQTDISIGTIDQPLDVTLDWRAGREAAKHDVYFSSDEQAVIDGTAGATTVTETSYGPLSLDLATTYYWRVDEVNEAESPAAWQGDVWNFATQEYYVVDDFESYNDLDPTDPNSNRIFNAWIDGYEQPTNGSIVGYESPPFAERGIVNGGKQSMPLAYDNSGTARYSEATLTLSPSQDWTKQDIKTLTLWFRGDAANTAAPMYVALNGSTAVYHKNPDAVAIDTWTQWNISMTDFSNQGVVLTNVNTISIGLGDRNNPQPGGLGTMYFDDIRLYR